MLKLKGKQKIDYQKEQAEIIKTIRSVIEEHCATIWNRKTWNKFKGNTVARIVAYYLKKHIPDCWKVVGPDVFIGDNPTQFDLMVIDSGTKTYPFTSAYPLKNIRRIIEVKTSGVFNIDKDVGKVRQDFDSVLYQTVYNKQSKRSIKTAVPGLKAAYLSISEVINPVRNTSIRFGDRTKEILKPCPAFFLYDNGRKVIIQGEWKRFIEYVTEDI